MRHLQKALLLCSLLFVSVNSDGQASKSSSIINNLIKEVMALDMRDSDDIMAMWFPYEFFIESALAEGGTTRAAAERDVAFLKPYITILMMQTVEKPNGSKAYASEQDLRNRASLKLPDGSEVAALAVPPPKVVALVAAIKAYMSADPDGPKHMGVLVFPNKVKGDAAVVDAKGKGKLVLNIKAATAFPARQMTWRTPLDSLVAAGNCAKCGEGLSAKWTFCPFCGEKISKQ